MSYDNPIREVFTIIGKQFGADNETASYIRVGPPGKKGIVRDIMVNVTEDMVGTTTVPEINVGSAASVLGTLKTEYARFRLGTTAILGYVAATHGAMRARALCDGNPTPPVSTDYAGHVELETAKIPADTEYVITLVAGSGGTETGAGDVEVTIDWI
jgi:hypothetical protein